MTINAKTRKLLNSLCSLYNGWKYPVEVRDLWWKLSEEFGIDILITGMPDTVAPDGGKCWRVPFEMEGVNVENSYFIYQVYEGNGDSLKNEYNMYFS